MTAGRIERHFRDQAQAHNRLILLLARQTPIEDGHFWEIETDIRAHYNPYPPEEELELALSDSIAAYRESGLTLDQPPADFFGTAACRLSFAHSFVTGAEGPPPPGGPTLANRVSNYEELVRSVIDGAGAYYRNGELEADPYTDLCFAADAILQHIQAMREAPPQTVWNGSEQKGWPPGR